MSKHRHHSPASWLSCAGNAAFGEAGSQLVQPDGSSSDNHCHISMSEVESLPCQHAAPADTPTCLWTYIQDVPTATYITSTVTSLMPNGSAHRERISYVRAQVTSRASQTRESAPAHRHLG